MDGNAMDDWLQAKEEVGRAAEKSKLGPGRGCFGFSASSVDWCGCRDFSAAKCCQGIWRSR